MKSQEIILDLQDSYPFDSYNQPLAPSKIFVRKVVPYTCQTYQYLKTKLEFMRRITVPTVIRLLRVLQQQGFFHLWYEYVPQSINSELDFLTLDRLEALKTELIMLSVYLADNRIATEFNLNCVGVDNKRRFRYYVDIGFDMRPDKDAHMQNSYICQINRMCRALWTQTKKSCRSAINKMPEASVVTEDYYEPKSPISQRAESKYGAACATPKPVIREKSVTSKRTLRSEQKAKSPPSNPLELLQNIELRIGQLKTSVKRISSEDQTKMSVRQKPKSRIADTKRKYSADPNIKFNSHNSFSKNRAPSPQNLQNTQPQQQPKTPQSPYSPMWKTLQFIYEQQQQRRSPQNEPSANRFEFHAKLNNAMFCCDNQSIRKEPKCKSDFEELKKQQFENFAHRKQNYVREFLDVLIGDEGQNPEKKLSETTLDDDKTRGGERRLKDRIRMAIKQSDEALERYRRQMGSPYTPRAY